MTTVNSMQLQHNVSTHLPQIIALQEITFTGKILVTNLFAGSQISALNKLARGMLYTTLRGF